MLSDELRFGKEFTPAQIITVIKHLQIYLSASPPHRHYARTKASVEVSVVHGLKPICQRVTKIELGSGTSLGENLDLKAKTASTVNLVAEEIESTPELWAQNGPERMGAGCRYPAGSGQMGRAGQALRHPASRREGLVGRHHPPPRRGRRLACGIRIFSKRPVSVWLRVLGASGHQADNWASSTGSFAYDYMRAIMLPDALKSHDHPVMILENKSYVPGQICEVMMGEHSRQIKLVEFLEEGEDYVRAAFEWQQTGKG